MDTVRAALNSLVRPGEKSFTTGDTGSTGGRGGEEGREGREGRGGQDVLVTEGTGSTEQAVDSGQGSVVSEEGVTGGAPVVREPSALSAFEQDVASGKRDEKIKAAVAFGELMSSIDPVQPEGRPAPDNGAGCGRTREEQGYVYPMPGEALRLNLGAGRLPLSGWVNLDRKTGQEVWPLPYGDGTVDEIRASHVLEHFSHTAAGMVVAEWVRVLRPGGRLSIAVPDFEAIARHYLNGVPIDVQGYVMGGHTDADDRHGAAYDRETLHELMADAGLVFIEPWESEQQDCAALPISLNLRGTKPVGGSAAYSGTRAVLATARFGPALHHRCAYEGLVKLGIPYQVSQGCFWHQILSELIEAAIADPGCDRVLTLDFDTIFTEEHVRELHRLMDAFPEARAIVPVQSKRCSDDALFTISDGKGGLKKAAYVTDFNRNLTPINTGHFGLTLFNADCLRAMARPWMCPKPSSAGRWRDGHVEADIDFWSNWKASGHGVYLANQVRVGHVQEVITWPGEGFKPVHQSMNEFQLHGQPVLGDVV